MATTVMPMLARLFTMLITCDAKVTIVNARARARACVRQCVRACVLTLFRYHKVAGALGGGDAGTLAARWHSQQLPLRSWTTPDLAASTACLEPVLLPWPRAQFPPAREWWHTAMCILKFHAGRSPHWQ